MPCQGNFVMAPKRHPAHFGGGILGQSARDFTVLCKELQFWEGKVAEAVVPLHEFGLVVGGGEIEFLVLLKRRSWIEREGIHVGGGVGLLLCASLSR